MNSILLFIALLSFNQSVSVKEYRRLYFEAGENNLLSEKLIAVTESDYKINNTAKAYRGAAFTILADTYKNPFEKLSKFNEGKKLLEEAISADKKNIEFIFLRFTIQCECPKFLKYSDQITTDKQLLLENINTHSLFKSDPTFKNKVKKYLLNCKCLTEAEKKKL